MRRWMIVLTIVGLALALAALPGAAKGKHQPGDVVEFTSGEIRYGATEARTGEYAGCITLPDGSCKTLFGKPGWTHLMDPHFNKCFVEEGTTLTWMSKNTAILVTAEDCSPRFPLPGPSSHVKIVHITPGGALKMSPGQGFWMKVPGLTGCDLNGTFPIYHGRFDGKHLHATSHYNSICDEGTAWQMFGISAADGPFHVTYEFDLYVDE